MASKDSKDSKDETAAFQARWTLLEAARLPGGAVWEPLRRHRSLDVVLVWAAAHAIHWLIQQPAEWLLLAVYSAAVVARLLALRPATAITWLAAWALADYVVYSLVLPATSATTASLMVHSVVVVKLQGLNLRGAGLLAIAAALVFARDPPQLTAWHRLMASHCTVFGCGWLLTRAAAYVYERFDELALTHGFRAPDAPVFVVTEVASNHVRILWSQTTAGRQQTREYVVEVNGTIVEHLPNDESSTTVHGLAMGEHYCVRLGACAGKDVYYSVPVIVRTALVEPSPPISILASPGPGSEAGETIGSMTDLRDRDRTVHDDRPADDLLDARLDEDAEPALMERAAASIAAATAALNSPSGSLGRHLSAEALSDLDRHRFEQMQTELHRLEKQRVEVEQQLRDASERAQAELAALERETARLREAKKQDDGSKSRLRQSSKAVEEAKTRAELAKTKVDKELRTEQDVAASLELQMEQVHSAQEQVRRSLLDLEKRSAAKASVSDAERKAQRQKLEVARKQLADTSGQLADRRAQLQQLRADNAAARAQAEQDRTLLGQLLTQLRLVQTHHVDQETELRVVFERYYQLLEDNRVLQERLHEVMQGRLTLMAELAHAQTVRDLHKQALFSTLGSSLLGSGTSSGSSSPFKLGTGSTSSAHGTTPTPSPPVSRLGSSGSGSGSGLFAAPGPALSATSLLSRTSAGSLLADLTPASSPATTAAIGSARAVGAPGPIGGGAGAVRRAQASDTRNAAMPVLESVADEDDVPLSLIDSGGFGPVGLFHDPPTARFGTATSTATGASPWASGSLLGGTYGVSGAGSASTAAASASTAGNSAAASSLGQLWNLGLGLTAHASPSADSVAAREPVPSPPSAAPVDAWQVD